MRLSYAVSVSILLAWVAVAFAAGQPLTATEGSHLLLRFGACDGSLMTTHEWWRLFTSQWLHSKPYHMLLNAAVVAFAGALLERRTTTYGFLCLYVIGGAIAQFASVLAYPDLVTSGASQAMLVLCGAALLLEWSRSPPSTPVFAMLAIIAVQMALDVKDAHTIKVGHAVALMLGLAAGGAIRFRTKMPLAAVS